MTTNLVDDQISAKMAFRSHRVLEISCIIHLNWREILQCTMLTWGQAGACPLRFPLINYWIFLQATAYYICLPYSRTFDFPILTWRKHHLTRSFKLFKRSRTPLHLHRRTYDPQRFLPGSYAALLRIPGLGLSTEILLPAKQLRFVLST